MLRKAGSSTVCLIKALGALLVCSGTFITLSKILFWMVTFVVTGEGAITPYNGRGAFLVGSGITLLVGRGAADVLVTKLRNGSSGTNGNQK